MHTENELRQFTNLWKLPMADRLIKHGGQANPICQLCRCRPESHTHLVFNCSYAKDVWARVQTWSQLPSLTTSTHTTQIKAWWTNLIHNNVGQPETSRVQITTYTAWNLGKERCRWVFDNNEKIAIMTQQTMWFLYNHNPIVDYTIIGLQSLAPCYYRTIGIFINPINVFYLFVTNLPFCSFPSVFLSNLSRIATGHVSLRLVRSMKISPPPWIEKTATPHTARRSSDGDRNRCWRAPCARSGGPRGSTHPCTRA
ncbi:hypothetical protein HU200_011334 [Digitaria exilis]|uniref:Reverse transcriptase zinc-binding domain-containing protein n=1 Tax=Digitaria exilis TaxID=1010633 RepID=A0A835KMS0_9POAL|nr:hypothetical protein HU200_011334 [Digitaria exilis]